MVNESDHAGEEEELQEEFIELQDGEITGGRVVADLDGYEEQALEEDEEDETAYVGEEDYMDDSIHLFQGHTSAVYAVSWCPTASDLVVTGGSDDIAFLWRVGEDAMMENQGDVLELRGHKDTVSSLEFNHDGTLVASGSMDGTVRVWDSKSGRCLHTLDGPSDTIEWIQWHPRGNVLIAGSSDFTSWMWSGQTGEFMMTFTGHAGSVTCGSFTPDGKTIVTGGGEGDGSLRVWDPKSGQALSCVEGPHFHSTGITCLAVHPNGQTVLSGSESGSLKLVSVEHGRVLGSFEGHQSGTSIEGLAFMNNLPVCASGGMDGNLIVWDVATFAPRVECRHPEGITTVLAHPQSPMIITGSIDGIVRCWDPRSGECSREFHGHQDVVQDIALSPDGNLILSGGEDDAARVFDLRSDYL